MFKSTNLSDVLYIIIQCHNNLETFYSAMPLAQSTLQKRRKKKKIKARVKGIMLNKNNKQKIKIK